MHLLLSALQCADGLQAWLYIVALVYNYWIQMRHVPYYHTWVNCFFAFCNCTFAWGSFLLLVGTYMRAHWSALTDAFYAGVVLSLLSMFLTGLRYDTFQIQTCSILPQQTLMLAVCFVGSCVTLLVHFFVVHS